MGMSTHVIGFRPPDDAWKRHKAVWDSCNTANVVVPDATVAFFDYRGPDERGVEVELTTEKYNTEGREGIEVDVSKLPPGLSIIRFYNAR